MDGRAQGMGDGERPGLRPELEQFYDDLFSKGLYVLPCGGGALPEIKKALAALEPRYGAERLRALCLELLFETPGEAIRVPEVLAVAAGVLYHVADEATLESLQRLRAEGRTASSGTLDALISGLCDRFGKPMPEGIEPLDPQEAYARFGVV